MWMIRKTATCERPLFANGKVIGINNTQTVEQNIQYFCRNDGGAYTGASIPMGQGGHVPPNIWTGGHYHECPPNISRVISATFYPCSIFLIS